MPTAAPPMELHRIRYFKDSFNGSPHFLQFKNLATNDFLSLVVAA